MNREERREGKETVRERLTRKRSEWKRGTETGRKRKSVKWKGKKRYWRKGQRIENREGMKGKRDEKETGETRR